MFDLLTFYSYFYYLLLLFFLFHTNALQNVLSKRRFTGKIEVDHKEQTMEISVVPRDNHIADAVTNTRSLSGGERSYTTVAFLISLWACVDHPFFFLDEYDVFAVCKNIFFFLLIFQTKFSKYITLCFRMR